MSGQKTKYKRLDEHCDLPFSHLLNDSQRDILRKNANLVHYRKKDVIFRQDTRTSTVIFIQAGFAKIYKQARNKRTTILKVVKEGQYIGLLSVFGDKVHQYSASAITDCVICEIDYTIFRSVIAENGKYSLEILHTVSRDGLYIFDKLIRQSHKQLPGRVADVLLYFAEEVYQNHSFTFPFTRQELAEFAGTTKESFIRTLTEFRNDRIIETDGASVSIKSMDIIRTLSNLG